MSGAPILHSASRCRSCNAPIIWALTDSERLMPVDAEPSDEGNLVLFREGTTLRVRVTQKGQGNHRPHFATCPETTTWRR